MFRTIVLSSAVLAAAVALGGGAAAQGGGATAMQPGERMRLGPILGDRTVRQVMISEGGGGIEIVYDMAPGAPQSQRVLRHVLARIRALTPVRRGRRGPLRAAGRPAAVQLQPPRGQPNRATEPSTARPALSGPADPDRRDLPAVGLSATALAALPKPPAAAQTLSPINPAS